VGPVYRGGSGLVKTQLASCYRRSLEIAERHDVQTIAFPGISTGIYGYPQREAASIAVATVVAWLAEHALPRKVVMCTYDEDATEIMNAALA
jgi:O-acetyl-ADP-ribose deacetylase (regulator of RNase III)